MHSENVHDSHRESASYQAMVDGKQDIPLLRLLLYNHLRREVPPKLQRTEMSIYIYCTLEISYSYIVCTKQNYIN